MDIHEEVGGLSEFGPGATAVPATPPESAALPAGRDLDRALVRGIAWTGAARFTTQLVGWASTLIVARLLAPTDFGLVGMAMVYVALLQVVNELGLGAAIIQRRDLTEGQIARLGGLGLGAGVVFVAISILAAGAVARFFGEPGVRGIVTVSSLAFLASALQIIPRALLARDFEFRKLAWVDSADALIAAATTLALAALGWRYWALVLGPLGGRTASTVLVNAWRPHRLAWPRQFHTIADTVTFGWQVVVARLAWYFYSNADFTVVGRALGSAALGAYTLGWTIASIPVDRVGALVASVTGALFSAEQHDRAALQRSLRNLTEALALVTFPAAVGIALVADEFVLVALGAQWRPAILPLQLLALSAALRSVSTLLPQIIVSTGHAKRNMQLTILATLILPTLFYVGSRWGTAGVAAAWVLGHPVFVLPLFLFYVLHLTGMRLSAYLRALSPATGLTVVMAAAVLAVRSLTPSGWPASVQLAGHVATGVAAYGAMLFVVHRERVRALWVLVREVRS